MTLAGSDISPFCAEIEMYQNYPSEEARNVHFAKKQGKLLSLGSLGYLLSYRKALVQGICSASVGNDYITVFDDDILLHADWSKILEAAYWQLPDNPAVIMLGAIQYHWGRGINWFSENLYCCNGTSIASHATVIHKEYAHFMIDEIEKFILPFDIGALHYLKSNLFSRSFVIYPNVLIQETSESDIADTKNQSTIGQTHDNVYRWELEKYKEGLA
jgi:GR25 family glycosyltransferase involved in LPS biosynthesis